MEQTRKEELLESSKAYFENYPSVDSFFVTEDGMFFIERGPAVDHSHRNSIEMIVIKRSEIEEKKGLKELCDEAAKRVSDALDLFDQIDNIDSLRETFFSKREGLVDDMAFFIQNSDDENEKENFVETLKIFDAIELGLNDTTEIVEPEVPSTQPDETAWIEEIKFAEPEKVEEPKITIEEPIKGEDIAPVEEVKPVKKTTKSKKQ